MNKLIIICGSDCLGKGTLIKNLCNYYDYKNITIRHCDKPPKNLSTLESSNFQFKCFEQEFKLINDNFYMDDTYCYHNNIIIYDRFHLGEFVYSQMFRGNDHKTIKEKIEKIEEKYLNKELLNNTYLILLTADSEFCMKMEDGNSLSQDLKKKQKEIELFKKAMEISLIKNKINIKVNDGDNFRDKEEIFNEVLNFIK